MKAYRIVTTDPNVQSWFNKLFDQAELSRAIECMARNRLEEAKITVELEPIFGKETPCFLSKIKKWIQNPLD